MNHPCTMLYQTMLADIREHRTKSLKAEQRVELCFQTAEAYWKKLQQKLVLHPFKTKEEEINFFKHCSPKFTAAIEYYRLVYHSFLFRPLDPVECLSFWKREASRLAHFVTENREFCDYYRSGADDRDAYYFLREACRGSGTEAKRSDAEAGAVTNGDSVLANWWALQRYAKYAAGQAKKLTRYRGMS